MDRIDSLPKDVREVIHDHGLTVVDALLTAGITKGNVMRHLITVIKQGSSAWGNGTRGRDQLDEFERTAHEQLQRRISMTKRGGTNEPIG
jgi:hypothetical protein